MDGRPPKKTLGASESDVNDSVGGTLLSVCIEPMPQSNTSFISHPKEWHVPTKVLSTVVIKESMLLPEQSNLGPGLIPEQVMIRFCLPKIPLMVSYEGNIHRVAVHC